MLIYPEVYIRESDGSRETYVSISDLITKLAATWSKVLKPLRSWKVEMSPEIFEPYSDGTDEAVSEFLKSAFPTIDISNTQLSALQALCGGEVDILLYDANETHFIPVFWGVSIFISVIEEGAEFSKIQISAERKARYALDIFKDAGIYLSLENVTNYETTERGHNPQVITANNPNPQVYYFAGIYNRTYVLWVQKGGVGYSVENMVFHIDHDADEISESVGVGAGTEGATDSHGHGALIVADDGSILVAHEQLTGTGSSAHNSPILIKKSDAVEDISSFSLEATITGSFCYPKLFKITDGTIFLIVREADGSVIPRYLRIFSSTDNGSNWDAGVRICDVKDAGEDYRMAYSSMPLISKDHKIQIFINSRWDTSSGYPDCYYVRSTDGITFTNMLETWSKNIVSGGLITRAELDANCLIEHTDTTSDNRQVTAGYVTNNNIFFLQEDKTSGTITLHLRFLQDGVLQKVQITTPILKDPPPYYYYRIIVHSEHKIDIIVPILVSDIAELQRWRTTDKGLSWSKVEDITTGSSYHRKYPQITTNYQDVPSYIILVCSYFVSEDYADVTVVEYLKS